MADSGDTDRKTFTISSPAWDSATQSYPRIPGACVLMRTKHYRDGHRVTEPIGIMPDPESAAAYIARMVRWWSVDASLVPEECPSFYFVPVPREMPQ